jgi:hypothetical protein
MVAKRNKAPQPDPAQYRREMVGVFRSAEALEAAISGLASAGWDRAEMSLLGEKEVLSPGRSTHQVADARDTDRRPVVSDTDVRQERTLAASMGGVVAAFAATGATILTGGTALAAIVGAAVAGGGATIAIEAIGRWLGGERAESLKEQFKHGGILLWVMLRNEDEELRARELMLSNGAVAVHAHDLGSS